MSGATPTLCFAPTTQSAIVVTTNVGGDAQGNLARTQKAENEAALAIVDMVVKRQNALKNAAPPASPVATPTTAAAPVTSAAPTIVKAKLKCTRKGKKRVCK